MSRHFYKTTHEARPIEVLIGWDRPLQGFFMVIQWLDVADEDDDESEIVYSNLNDASLQPAWPSTLTPFIRQLETLNIAVPQKMLQSVLTDGESNVGNNDVHYS